jgi:hypothetical protein
MQGGVVQLPMPDSATGVMRGRFHPENGALYTCGLYAWAGNRQSDGGFYRVRPTGKPAWLPIRLHAKNKGIELQFTDALDRYAATRVENYSVEVWSLQRTANYGSKHINQHPLKITKASLGTDAKTVGLEIPELAPTWCMEIKAKLRGADGTEFTRVIHNTIHKLEGE